MCRLSLTNPSAWCAPLSWKSLTLSPRAMGPQGTEYLPYSAYFSAPSETSPLSIPPCFPQVVQLPGQQHGASLVLSSWLLDPSASGLIQHSQSRPSALLCTPRVEWRMASRTLRMCVGHACLLDGSVHLLCCVILWIRKALLLFRFLTSFFFLGGPFFSSYLHLPSVELINLSSSFSVHKRLCI